jgi:AAA15 family ATPase/GTPase
MTLNKIHIRNFRSVGKQGLELTIAPTCTTFIGENNVGKSSIFEAVKRVLDLNIQWEKEDWYASDQSQTIEIQLEFTLNDDQIKKLIRFLNLSMGVKDFKEKFTSQFTCGFMKTLDQSFHILKLGEMQIDHTTGWFGELDDKHSYNPIKWTEIVEDYEAQENDNLMQFIKKLFYKKKKSGEKPRIEFNKEIFPFLLDFVAPNIIIIEEFREKPLKNLIDTLTSPKGSDLASVLFNFKNGRPQHKEKFEKIREKFCQLFPTLELDVIRENNEIKILILKPGIESTTFYIGAGIIQSLHLLTHLIAHKDKVLFLDHPELHLHPHAQRRLATFVEEEKDRQTIIITHSPYFIDLNKDSNITRFVQIDAQTEIFEPPQDYFKFEDYSKLEQFLDIDTKELFFASKVLLVEGPTELGALPIFSLKMDYNFDEYGVSVINIGGKHNFKFFVKLCKGFGIPYFIIADKDAEKLLTNYKSKLILPSDFEALLPDSLIEEANKIVGTSKPRIGRYVARKMVEKGEIPDEIKQIIDSLKKLQTLL